MRIIKGFRRCLKYTVLLILWAVLVHVLHGLTLDRIIQYVQVQVSSPDFPRELNTYRMAFLADTQRMSDSQLQRVIDRLNLLDLDVLLLGGDFSPSDGIYRRHLAMLIQVKTRDGIWGVEGNYDHSGILREPAAYYGIELLNNRGIHLHPRFYLAGIEDLWHGRPNHEAAMAGYEAGDFVLFLAHNPDASMRFPSTDINLMLSGHTHGGQMTLFGLYAPFMDIERIPLINRRAPSDYGQRFVSGFAHADSGTLVYTSRGVWHERWFRLFARPEVTIIELSYGQASHQVGTDWLDVMFWLSIISLPIGAYSYRKIKRKA